MILEGLLNALLNLIPVFSLGLDVCTRSLYIFSVSGIGGGIPPNRKQCPLFSPNPVDRNTAASRIHGTNFYQNELNPLPKIEQGTEANTENAVQRYTKRKSRAKTIYKQFPT